MNIIAKGSGVTKDGKVIPVQVVTVEVEHWDDVRARVDAIAKDRRCKVMRRPMDPNDENTEDVPEVGVEDGNAFVPRGDQLFGLFTRRACGSDPVCVRRSGVEDADFVIQGGSGIGRRKVLDEIRFAVEGGEYYAVSPGQCGSCGSEREKVLTGRMNGAFKVDDVTTPLNGWELDMWELEAQVQTEAELASLTLTKEEWVR